jgi:hypothetical protein
MDTSAYLLTAEERVGQNPFGKLPNNALSHSIHRIRNPSGPAFPGTAVLTVRSATFAVVQVLKAIFYCVKSRFIARGGTDMQYTSISFTSGFTF